MSNTKGRLDRLEATLGTTDNVIIAHVPDHWNDAQVDAGLEQLVAENCLCHEWKTEVMKVPFSTEAKLIFAGNLSESIQRIAAEGGRIGMREVAG